MLLSLLFSLVVSKKIIHLCNDHRSPHCSGDDIVFITSNNQEMEHELKQILKEDTETEIEIHSEEENISIEFNSYFLKENKINIKTTSDSKKIKIIIKNEFKTNDEIIYIEPNCQFKYSSKEINQIPTKDKNKKEKIKSKIPTEKKRREETSNEENYTNHNINESIIIYKNSTIKAITGSTFVIPSKQKTKTEYFLQLDKEINFLSNTFEYDQTYETFEYVIPIFMNYAGQIKLNKCKFIKCICHNNKSKHEEVNVFYSASNFQVEVIIERCEFNECGNKAESTIIGIYNEKSTLKMMNNLFIFENESTSSRILTTSTTTVIIDKCQFHKCGEINIKTNTDMNQNERNFEFTNNNVKSNSQPLLSINKITTKPNISFNTIEKCEIKSTSYLIKIFHSIKEIELVNDTFLFNQYSNNEETGSLISTYFYNIKQEICTIIYSNISFYNNKNNESKNKNSIFITNPRTKIIYENSEFKYNECNQSKSGIITINKKEGIIIEECIFKNNIISSGAIISIFYQSNEINKKENEEEALNEMIIIQKSEFTNNYCEGEITGILIEGYNSNNNNNKIKSVDILSCKFYNNGNKHTQRLIKVTSDTITFDNNEIKYEYQELSSGSLKINNRGPIIINNSIFHNCIYSGESSIEITGESTLINICNSEIKNCNSNKYSIIIRYGIVEISNSSILFTDNNKSCCGIKIETPESVTIEKCQFINNRNINEEEEETGCLFIYRRNGSITFLQLKDILFEACCGNTYNTLYVKSDIDFLDPIRNLTIQNIENTINNKYIYGFQINQDLFFERCKFNKCRSNNTKGGGSSSSLKVLNKITFFECIWNNNSCYENGGAFQYGNFLTNEDKILEFKNCNFTNNETPKSGGSISLQTHNNVLIDNCTFIRNKSGIINKYEEYYFDGYEGKGGAIFINPRITTTLSFLPIYEISRSNFIENEGFDAHAIYIDESNNMNVLIDDKNQFINNGENGTSIITDQNTEIGESTFIKTPEIRKSSNMIKYTKSASKNYNDLTFYQQITISESEEAHFYNCTFDNCNFSNDQNQKHQYVLNVHSNQFSFESSTIKFDDVENACGGIHIDYYCNFTISDSHFIRCNVKPNFESGGICYEPINGKKSNRTFYIQK